MAADEQRLGLLDLLAGRRLLKELHTVKNVPADATGQSTTETGHTKTIRLLTYCPLGRRSICEGAPSRKESASNIGAVESSRMSSNRGLHPDFWISESDEGGSGR